jgi:hypothetical protein
VAVGSPPSCLALAGVGADWPGQPYITAGSVARRACTAGKGNGVDVAAGDAAVGSVRVSVATSGTAVGLSEVSVSLCVAASGLVGVPGHVAVVGLEGIDAALWIAGVLKRSILITTQCRVLGGYGRTSSDPPVVD